LWIIRTSHALTFPLSPLFPFLLSKNFPFLSPRRFTPATRFPRNLKLDLDPTRSHGFS
jgi:hypothetical protein